MLSFASLGEALATMYVNSFRDAMKPTLHRLNDEWGLMKVSRGASRKFVHYCPSGDIRAVRGKVCDLCQVGVPEAVQFLAQVLIPYTP